MATNKILIDIVFDFCLDYWYRNKDVLTADTDEVRYVFDLMDNFMRTKLKLTNTIDKRDYFMKLYRKKYGYM